MSPGADALARGKQSPPAFAGRLSAVSLFDAIQFLLLNRKTGTLTVRSGSSVAYLTFSEGQIMTALDEGLREGEPVVERAVQWTDGTFEFAPGPVPPDRKIQSSTDNVLLEAARRIDEANAHEAVEDAPSLEADLVDKQARGSALSEAFRSAVAGVASRSHLRGWRGAAVRELSRPGARRLLLGPGSHATIVGCGEVRALPETASAEVAAWMDELAPRASERAHARGEPGPLRRTVLPGGEVLWALRHSGPEGDWLSVSLASPRLPDGAGLGLEDAQFERLEGTAGRVVRIVSPIDERAPGGDWPALSALAAWISRRAARRPEVAWVVETLPLFDWQVLPGRVRSVPPTRLRRPGSLTALCRASGASLVALAEPSESTLLEARRLAREGIRVAVLATFPARDLDRPGRDLANRAPRGAEPPPGTAGDPEVVWEIRGGPPPDFLPLSARILDAP